MRKNYNIPDLPLPYALETSAVLKQLAQSYRRLSELKGIAQTIPNENILISTLTLQEAKDSSAIENIVTTQDDLYKAGLDLKQGLPDAAAKEVLAYREAVEKGFRQVRNKRLLTNNMIISIQAEIEKNSAGFRKVPGTMLKHADGTVIYVPPQDGAQVLRLMRNLESFINDDEMCPLDPLIKLAIIHHQFESINPFYDGNGRTGRIVCVLYLVAKGLLDLPILYLSRYITHNKGEYYRLIQAIRDKESDNAAEWEAWILFILKGIEETATETISLVKGISRLMAKFKETLRPLFGKQYRHELLNNLFFYPYTKIEFMERDLMVKRKTAAKYLDMIVDAGLLTKKKVVVTNYYINTELVNLFTGYDERNGFDEPPIETVIDAV